jgi:hypothetical protein
MFRRKRATVQQPAPEFTLFLTQEEVETKARYGMT